MIKLGCNAGLPGHGAVLGSVDRGRCLPVFSRAFPSVPVPEPGRRESEQLFVLAALPVPAGVAGLSRSVAWGGLWDGHHVPAPADADGRPSHTSHTA